VRKSLASRIARQTAAGIDPTGIPRSAAMAESLMLRPSPAHERNAFDHVRNFAPFISAA